MSALALTLAAISVPAAAMTSIGGDQLANVALTSAGDPYVVTSDLVVLNGATLSIEAGVTVYVDPGVNLIVRSGRLRSLGTEAAPVVITSSAELGGTPAAGDWGELRFEDGTNDIGTGLDWTEIRYGSGVTLQGASPTFDFSTISFMSGPAIAMDLASFPKGEGNSATDNALNGVDVPAGDITAPGKWELRGIPFVLQGRVSIGQTPAISSLTPDTVQQLDTVEVTITGQRLDGALAFVIGGTGITPTIQPGGTATSLTVELALDETATLGPQSFSVVTPAGVADGDAAGLTLTVTGPTPDLLQIAPDTVVAGQSDFTLTANGDRFATGVELLVDGTPVPTTRLSSTQLTADVGAASIVDPGDLAVLVRNPDPGSPGGFLESVPLTLTVEPPQITLTPDPLNVITQEVSNLLLSTPLVAPAGGFTFDVSSDNPAVAAVPAQVTVPEGSSSVAIPVTGGSTGQATVTATRLGFIEGTAQIAVVPPPILVPVTPVLAPVVGVVVTEPPGPGDDFQVDPTLAPEVGIVIGSALFSLGPDTVTRGDTGVTVTAVGTALDDVTAVTLEPPDDITVNGSPTVAPDGLSLTFNITLDPAAATGPRTVRLETATGNIPPAGPGADRLRVTRVAPQIISLEPIDVLAGSNQSILIRGADLHDASSVQATPPDGLTFATTPVVNGAGTEATIQLLVDGAAALGPRVITITTPGGTSSSTGEPANTLNVVADLGTPFFPLTARPVGVVVTETPDPDPDFTVEDLAARPVGAIVGSAITGVTPTKAIIGTTALDVTIEGLALDAATGVSFLPPDGITLNGAPTVAPDGLSITVNIDIDGAGPVGTRQIVVATPSGNVPAADPRADRFDVTFPPPQIESLIPNRGLLGTTVPLEINGEDLNGVTDVTFEPADGLALLAAPTVNGPGTQVNVDVVIDPGASLGFRTVRVTTPGGTSTATQAPANAFEVTDQPGSLLVPLLSRPVGVVVTEPDPPDPTLDLTSLARPVGVVVTEPVVPDPDFAVEALTASPVGVIVGSATTGLSPTTAVPGAVNVDVVIGGVALDAATGVQFTPPDDITVNGTTVAPDGSSVTANISLALGAARGFRQVQVLTAGGPVAHTGVGTDRFFVGDLPEVISVDPNTVVIGSSFTLTINGTDLDDVISVDFVPPDDILAAAPVVNGGGTQITIDVLLGGSVVPGARVVTVTTPAGTSTSTAEPANTLNIVGSLTGLDPTAYHDGDPAAVEDDLDEVVLAAGSFEGPHRRGAPAQRRAPGSVEASGILARRAAPVYPARWVLRVLPTAFQDTPRRSATAGDHRRPPFMPPSHSLSDPLIPRPPNRGGVGTELTESATQSRERS